MRRLIISAVVLSLASFTAGGAPDRIITSVRTDRSSLNVAAGESVTLTVHLTKPGTASVIVLDRDGYAVRTLAGVRRVHGPASFTWNGRDDAGQLVADEAYSFRVEWRGDKEMEVYNPGESVAPVSAVHVGSYDRRTATLVYTLATPSRVHAQAGTAVPDPATKKLAGPVLKTVVNREPRVAGSVAEHWNGSDESGAIFIPDLENFVVAVAASPLPENSVVTFGNRKYRFVDTLANRKGASYFVDRQAHHHHHTGLRTENDVSPALKIEPLNARWSRDEKAWIVDGDSLRARIVVEGPTASAFRRHPATIETFIDGLRIGNPRPKRGDRIEVPLGRKQGTHQVSVNWNSDWGPVAANTIQVRAADGSSKAARRVSR